MSPGGGAFVAGYLNVFFMGLVGVAPTVMALGVVYLAVMLAGSRLMELPPPGAVLTAWTAAAITGPVIITELSNRAKAVLPPGADRVNIYDTPLQVLAGLLAVGFVLTMLVRPLRTTARPARCR